MNKFCVGLNGGGRGQSRTERWSNGGTVADGRVEGRADGMERSKRGPRGPRTLTFVYFVLLHIFLLAVIVDEKLSF